MFIDFTHYGEPVPASRPRISVNGTYNPPKYQGYKDELVAALSAKRNQFNWKFPPKGNQKARAKFIKANQYTLNVHVYRSVNRGDWDNLGKTVSDALEQAGIIANDSQIKEGYVLIQTDKKEPRVNIQLSSYGSTK